MSNQLTGVLREIYPEKQPSATFTTRDFVVTEDGQYPQYVTFQATQGTCAVLDRLSVGETVTVHYNVRGKQYEKKDGSGHAYFNSLVAWKIETNKTNNYPQQSAEPQTTNDAPSNIGAANEPQDLPF